MFQDSEGRYPSIPYNMSTNNRRAHSHSPSLPPRMSQAYFPDQTHNLHDLAFRAPSPATSPHTDSVLRASSPSGHIQQQEHEQQTHQQQHQQLHHHQQQQPPQQKHHHIQQQQQQDHQAQRFPTSADWREHASEQPAQHDALRQDPVVSYASPQVSPRRVVERYGLSDDPRVSKTSTDLRPSQAGDEHLNSAQRRPSPPMRTSSTDRERPNLLFVSNTNRPSSPLNMVNGATSPEPPSSAPLYGNGISTSPSAQYAGSIPISPNYRAYAQQPTYVTPPTAHRPINPVFTPAPQPQEEVCVECAMRDEEMADVDVTTPGVWERESDADYKELLQKELEDEANGIPPNPTRPQARGDRLTEKHVKVWLTLNPRESTARQQTIDRYVRAQSALLEAEAVAHDRAMREAKQLDSRMKDTYSQLRRSAYDMGSTSTPVDDSGGVRIKPPRSPEEPNAAHARLHSREVTLLENGMIVEHVDVRKEEKEARERRRKEERRARKTSRSSGMDVMSVYSIQSIPSMAEAGVAMRPYSRYSQPSSNRPMSVLTAPLERLDARTSQASFSDVHSMTSASPRRRFFGFKNMSGGLLSQDSLAPSGMSGSMVDMHVALQREAQHLQTSHLPPRRSQLWSPIEVDSEPHETLVEEPTPKKKKKKKGLAKIWKIVTGSSKSDSSQVQDAANSRERNEDDYPLAPPPPISYLLNRSPGDLHNSQRHGSTTSLQSSSMSPRNGLSSVHLSPPTAPSSVLPSPASSKSPGQEQDFDTRRSNGILLEDEAHVKSMNSNSPQEVDDHTQQGLSSPSITPPAARLTQRDSRSSLRLSCDKNLPPIPPGEYPHLRPGAIPSQQDTRPRTMHSFDPRQLIPQSQSSLDLQPPQAPFRRDVRRQSFNGVSSQPASRGPVHASTLMEERKSFGIRYDEFGASRRSLSRLSNAAAQPQSRSRPQEMTMLAPSKRRSFFGLSSIFGKKSQESSRASTYGGYMQSFPSLTPSRSPHEEDDPRAAGYDYASMNSAATRSSLAPPRRALAELVSQDPEFVAYRYPSNDQRLDLLR